MGRRVDVLFDLVDCLRYGAVAALLLQPLQTGEDAVGKDGLLVLDVGDLPVLLRLPLKSAVDGDHGRDDHDQRGNDAGRRDDDGVVEHDENLLSSSGTEPERNTLAGTRTDKISATG